MELSKFQRLKILRVQQNLSQKDVSDALGMTQSGYSALEKGKIKVTETHLAILKQKFNFDVDYILEGGSEAIVQSSSEIESLKQENNSLKAQVRQLMEMVSNLTTSVNMLSNQLGKLEGNDETYADEIGRIIPMATESVTHVAKRAA